MGFGDCLNIMQIQASFHHWFMQLRAAPEIWLWGLLLLHHFSRVECWGKKLIFFSKHQATHRAKGNKNNPQALAQNSNCSKGKIHAQASLKRTKQQRPIKEYNCRNFAGKNRDTANSQEKQLKFETERGLETNTKQNQQVYNRSTKTIKDRLTKNSMRIPYSS